MTSQNIDSVRRSGGASAAFLLILFFGTVLLAPLVVVSLFPPDETRTVTVYRDAPTIECTEDGGWFNKTSECTEGESTMTRTVVLSPQEHNGAVQARYFNVLGIFIPITVGLVCLVQRALEPKRA